MSASDVSLPLSFSKPPSNETDFEYAAKFSDGRFIKGVIPILDTQEPQLTSKVQENKAQDLPKSQAS